MKKILILTILFTSLLSMAFALELILKDGQQLQFPNESFGNLPLIELTTYRTREEGVRRDVWQGIRFDNWLRDNGFTDFTTIRFESDDRYMMSFEKVAFDTTSCWMVVQNGNERYSPENYRIIFPNLTQNHWVRNISRVILEDFHIIPLPQKIHPMQALFASLTLYNNPAPFVDIRGYKFEDVMRKLGSRRRADVILYSSDGFKLSLEYPLHLRGAILELSPEGKYNLKSPQIPGGMWVKDIIYLQINKQATFDGSQLRKLIDLNNLLDWDLGHNAQVKVWKTRGSSKLGFADFLAMQSLSSDIRLFKLYKTP